MNSILKKGTVLAATALMAASFSSQAISNTLTLTAIPDARIQVKVKDDGTSKIELWKRPRARVIDSTDDMQDIWEGICADGAGVNDPVFNSGFTGGTTVTFFGPDGKKTHSPKLRDCCDKKKGKYTPKDPLPDKCKPPKKADEKEVKKEDAELGLLNETSLIAEEVFGF